MPDQTEPTFTSRILVYVPAYNCANKIVSVLQEIPEKYWSEADILVIDNCSPDDTADHVVAANDANAFPCPVQVIRTYENLNYAGSQKLAYKLALRSPSVEWVIMLHGDGQYEPELLSLFEPYFDERYGVVQGYRSKKEFGAKEETPWSTYAVIKALDTIESGILGFPLYEWHSGFVMYTTAFLRQIDLDRLTTTRHIDGNLLFAAETIGVKIKRLPIWKRYQKFPGFVGLERVNYVLNVFRLVIYFRLLKWFERARQNVLLAGRDTSPAAYSVISQAPAAD